MENWKNIVSITVKTADGKVYYYDCIWDALWLWRREIPTLEHGRLSHVALHDLIYFNDGDFCIFLDEMGMVIPPFRLKEMLTELPKEWFESERNRKAARWRRNGSKSRWRSPRRPKVYNEWRADNALLDDKEAWEEYGIRPRAKRLVTIQRSVINDDYDFIWYRPSSGRSWKKYRRNQWKGS